jgi:hypothetical protein
MKLIFVCCTGGMYIVDEVGSLKSQLLEAFPQLEKTSHHFSLSTRPSPDVVARHVLGVDEASFLRSVRPSSWDNGELLDELVRRRRQLSHEVDLLCGAYAHLTQCGYWLNHGGVFGVHYLVYTSPPRDGHSMFLCCVTDSDFRQLELTVLQRLSRSVRKRSMLLIAQDRSFRVEILDEAALQHSI